MNSNQKFWMIWNPKGRGPTFAHNTVESVRHEAERLARISPGTKFYILECVGSCQKNDVVWEGADMLPHDALAPWLGRDEIPF